MSIRFIGLTGVVLMAGALLALGPVALQADDSGYDNGHGPLAEARELIEMGSWGSAIWSLKRVLEESPRNADAHNLLAFSYRNIGETEKAEVHYDRALEIEPDHRGAHAYLGVLYIETGRAEQARDRLEALRDLCNRDCAEYRELRSAIRDHGNDAG